MKVLNFGSSNNNNLVASIRSLDLTTGIYEDVCDVQGFDLNACGLSQSNFIYCVARDDNNGQINPGQLVRVTCPLPTADGPSVGTLCFLGQVQGRPFSGTTDTKTDAMILLNGRSIFTYPNIDALVENGTGWENLSDSTAVLPRVRQNTNIAQGTVNIAASRPFIESRLSAHIRAMLRLDTGFCMEI